MENLVFNKLAELGIDYEFIEHPAALTTEDADRFTKVLEGVHTKSMFQTNKNLQEINCRLKINLTL